MTESKPVTSLSPDHLSHIEDHLDRRYIQPGKLPGTLTLVARRGEIAYLKAQGLMDVGRNKPVCREWLPTRSVRNCGLLLMGRWFRGS